MSDIGVDIEQIERFRLKREDSFLQNNYTEQELDYAFKKIKPEETLCGIFCAKEAVLRITGKGKSNMRNIEIVHDALDKPLLKDMSNIKISISHTDRYAVAVALRGD